MRATGVSQGVFAVTLLALGIIGLIRGDFGAIWEPVPKWASAREALAYLCALIAAGCGLGLLWPRAAAAAARVLFFYLVLWFVLFRLPVIWHAPTVAVTWEGCGETAVILAAAWVLYAQLATGRDRQVLGLLSGASGLRLARALFGLALIAFGVAHFAYVAQTASLVPAWLPAHVSWVYLTGAAYVAAGIAVLVGSRARPAAALAAVMMGLFTLLVWIPAVASAAADASQWSECLISWALTASAWVVADSYRTPPAQRITFR